MADIIIQQDGCLGRITLNRPKALNALSFDMVLEIIKALQAWKNDMSISCIIIEGSGDRAFCAGGDIQAIYDIGRSNPEYLQNFWRQEYALDYMIQNYPKPYIALMDGYTMGGGVGVSAHGSHRIVTERSIVAMPEVIIGFLPDVGGTWLLSRAPGKTGLYCGVTAANMNAADAIYAGFADSYVSSSHINELISCLREKQSVDDVIAKFSSEPEEQSFLKLHKGEIDILFSHDTILECVDALQYAGTKFANETLKSLDTHSPFAISCAFYAINNAGKLSNLQECLQQEYRFAYRSVYTKDLYEGIRAAVVDKDRSPKWEHESVRDVDFETVKKMFEPLGDLALNVEI